MPAVLTE